jgi:hypothetical protein
MDIGTAICLFVLLPLAAYHFIKRRGGPFVQYVISLFVYRPVRPAPVNATPDRSEAFSAPVRDVQRSNVQAEPPGMVAPTLQELRQLARAIEHNARGANKQQSLEQAFGVKKGGSASWRRASELFDEAMKEPAEQLQLDGR